jgi:hypothetical protein
MNRFLLSTAALLLLSTMTILAQGAPNPPGPTDGVPVDGGLTIFLGLGAAYGARKVYQALKNPHED